MRAIRSSNYIVEVHLERERVPSFDEFPFSVPSIRELYELEFPKPVTMRDFMNHRATMLKELMS